MKYSALIFTLLLCVLPHAGLAASLQDARAALQAGYYDKAFTQAKSIGTQDGLLLAAEALNTKVMLGQSSNAKTDSKLAMALSQQALAAEPENAEAKMLYAFAYGFNARSASTLTAFRKKLPQKIRAVIQTARVANPQDARSDALLAGWHLSVVYKAGAKRALKSYSASEVIGHEYFQKAITRMPNDALITGNYIMMLTALGKDSNLAQAKTLLQNLENHKPQSASEKSMLLLLDDLRATLKAPKKARKLAKQFLDW